MLKINELMAGDLVYRPDCVTTVRELHADGIIGNDSLRGIIGYDELEPIALTPEILLKNGYKEFKVDELNGPRNCIGKWWNKDGTVFVKRYVTDPYAYRKTGETVYTVGSGNHMRIGNVRYVHEFQHALQFCGKEKRIKL